MGHDMRWAHEGTTEYTSRDAHIGCASRRGDLEVLFYNLIEWFGGSLPWDRQFASPDMTKTAMLDILEKLKLKTETAMHSPPVRQHKGRKRTKSFIMEERIENTPSRDRRGRRRKESSSQQIFQCTGEMQNKSTENRITAARQ